MMNDLNPEDVKLYSNELFKLIDSCSASLSVMKPSEWAEKNRVLRPPSPRPGPFSFSNAPYARGILDLIADDTVKEITCLKGGQVGFSTSVIENAIAWIISENPGNILFMVGHAELLTDSVRKVDEVLVSCGIDKLIGVQVKRARNNTTGDTDGRKDFPGGYLKMGLANHKTLRNISMKFGFIDDYDGMKMSDKSSGSTYKLIKQRFASYKEDYKIFFISTPELEETSNTWAQYIQGDQRKFHIPCPCCGEYIPIEWEIVSDFDPGKMAGITWELDEDGILIPESVGYKCQKCDGFFDDRNKTELLDIGDWIPTAKPQDPGKCSVHLSALCAPTYMFGWEEYVREWISIHPVGEDRDEEGYKAFLNLNLGLPYKPTGKAMKASELQKNIRPYDIGIIPEKLSISDGNGRIVMLTCGSDLNGKEDDARLDYEILAHSESGATYSIDHGSIGTFIAKDKNPQGRKHYTYRHGAENSVWPILDELLRKKYIFDSDPNRKMGVIISGVDTGYNAGSKDDSKDNYAYQFVDNSNIYVVSLKGDDHDKSVHESQTPKTYRPSQNKGNLYLVATNYTKDLLSKDMKLKWHPELNSIQPFGFMNFPNPSESKYFLDNYFKHFESEQKIIDPKTNRYVWKKKSGTENHMYDCRLYALVVRDIFLDEFYREMKIKNGVWQDYVNAILKRK